MPTQYDDLSGRWIGRYEYDRGGQPTAFEALLSESGGLSGEIWEPNGFRDDMGPELSATLDGARVEGEVSFVKRYLDFEQGDHPIYEGTVNASLTRVEGRWRFSHQPGWGGRFVMMRKPQARQEVRRKATSDIEI